MFEQSETLQELWRIKQEIASEYASFRDFCKALIERQNVSHPEFANQANATPVMA